MKTKKNKKKLLTLGFAGFLTLMTSFSLGDWLFQKSAYSKLFLDYASVYTNDFLNKSYILVQNQFPNPKKEKKKITLGVYLDEEAVEGFYFLQKYRKSIGLEKQDLWEETKKKILLLSEDFAKKFDWNIKINKVGYWYSNDEYNLLGLYMESKKQIKRESDIVLAITQQHLHTSVYSEELKKYTGVRGCSGKFGNNIIMQIYFGDLFGSELYGKSGDLVCKLILSDELSHLFGADHLLGKSACVSIGENREIYWNKETENLIKNNRSRLWLSY